MTDRSNEITRRDFIKLTGVVVLMVGSSGCRRFVPGERSPSARTGEPPRTVRPTNTLPPVLAPTPTSSPGPTLGPAGGIPPADGYLLVDVGKCQGCATCMLACSLIHEGVESLSLSRIQVTQNPFASFPDDLAIAQCRQCVEPACLEACPTGALEADARYGYVRRVDAEACIGCGLCHRACPFTPSRVFLAADPAAAGTAKSRKCDLCAEAPYHWEDVDGGPDGKQACVAVCPVGAIAFTAQIPTQDGDEGYQVNLQGEAWATLGYPTS